MKARPDGLLDGYVARFEKMRVSEVFEGGNAMHDLKSESLSVSEHMFLEYP